MIKKNTKRRSEEEWQEIIAGQAASGQTIPEYCRDRNLCEKSFYGWRKRLHLNSNSKAAGFIQIRSEKESQKKDISIHTPGGYRLEVAPGTDEVHVKTVLQVLAGLS